MKKIITIEEIKQLVLDFGLVVDLDRWETPGSGGQKFLRIEAKAAGVVLGLEPLILYYEDVKFGGRPHVTQQLQMLLISLGKQLKLTEVHTALGLKITNKN